MGPPTVDRCPEYGPKTLSVGSTIWLASGVTPDVGSIGHDHAFSRCATRKIVFQNAGIHMRYNRCRGCRIASDVGMQKFVEREITEFQIVICRSRSRLSSGR